MDLKTKIGKKSGVKSQTLKLRRANSEKGEAGWWRRFTSDEQSGRTRGRGKGECFKEPKNNQKKKPPQNKGVQTGSASTWERKKKGEDPECRSTVKGRKGSVGGTRGEGGANPQGKVIQENP